jgi:hypothetical protein
LIAAKDEAKEKEAKEKAEKDQKDTADKGADGDNISGLLPASDADSVVRGTTKGRTDPFARVILPTVSTSSSSGPKAVQLASSSSKPFSNNNSGFSSSRTVVTSPISGSNTKEPKAISGLGLASAARLASIPKSTPANIYPGALISAKSRPIPAVRPSRNPFMPPERPQPSERPPLEVAIRDMPKAMAPQPDLAKAIFVTGVAQVNGQTQVIVKLPNESFSRYVSVGERLMDGRVLIKRVQEFSGMTPVVVLEELGIEVPRKVGDKPAVMAKDAPAPQR